jgi:hypothetical protein
MLLKKGFNAPQPSTKKFILECNVRSVMCVGQSMKIYGRDFYIHQAH